MFWDKAAKFYDLFENIYNGKVNREMCAYVASLARKDDVALECACGTGMITETLARVCAGITATDYSEGMLKKAREKCASYPNVRFEAADIQQLRYADDSFDLVLAGNVLHLLEYPDRAIREMKRVCRPGGRIILPTYVNKRVDGKENPAARLLQRIGAGFKRQFSYDSYIRFLRENGCENVSVRLIEGHMPCAAAVMINEKDS